MAGLATAIPSTAFADVFRLGDSGRMVVSASVNGGEPLELIVDTGASNTCLSETAAARLGLTPERMVRAVSPQGPRETPLVRLASVQTQGISCGELLALVLPDALMRGHDGLLGVDAFRGGKLVIGFAERTLSLAASGETPGLTAVQGSVGGNGILFVQVEVAGEDVLGMVDTGASGVFVNPPFMRQAGIAEGERIELRLGPRALQVRPLVSPMANWGDQPGALLGLSLLQHFGTVALDFPAAQLHIRA